jgi:hypothetical protein
MTHQVSTVGVTAAAIMRSTNFRRGLEDARAGRAPRFDELDDVFWSYERGRLFGFIAPLSMQLFVAGKLNPKALAPGSARRYLAAAEMVAWSG